MIHVVRRMVPFHDCPLCPDRYEEPTDLRVHLEVEHRKSELAVYAVNRHEGESRESGSERDHFDAESGDPSRTPPA